MKGAANAPYSVFAKKPTDRQAFAAHHEQCLTNERQQPGSEMTLKNDAYEIGTWSRTYSLPRRSPESQAAKATVPTSWSSSQRGQMQQAQSALHICSYDDHLLVALCANWFLRRQPRASHARGCNLNRCPTLGYVILSCIYFVSHIKRHWVARTKHQKEKHREWGLLIMAARLKKTDRRLGMVAQFARGKVYNVSANDVRFDILNKQTKGQR